MNKVKIALLGFGNVGTGVFKIFNMNKEEIIKRTGYEVEISKILVRDINKKRPVEADDKIFTTNFEDILNDDSIQIVVELIGGVEPAVDYMIQSMKRKKHVVTANKMAIATLGDRLFEEAEKNEVQLKYEASVAGGIPVIQGIKESLTANKIQEIIGIINGTTNYILTKMTQEGMDFETALKEAQEKGYAEADPTSDVEAYDAVYKLSILSSIAFGTKVDFKSIYREGICSIKPIDIEYAKEFGYVIKLLAIVKEDDNMLDLRVHPTMIPLNHPLANVNDSFNAIFIKGNAVGELMLYGRGAGDLPTGSAVVSDIISIVRNDIKENSQTSIENNYWVKESNDIENINSEYYIRIKVKDVPGVLGEITTIFGKNEVSMLSCIQKGKREDQVNLVFVTHHTLERNINRAIEDIKKLSGVGKLENVIRIENFK